MRSIPVQEFFNTIFDGLEEDEQIFCTTFDHHPNGGEGWPCNSGPKAIARRKRPAAEYFCTSSVTRAEYPRRNFENCERLFVVVLDDVNQKAKPNGLQPTYRIETSPGSEHWGYALAEPLEVHAADGVAERLVRAVYTGRGLTDEGGKMVAKMVRPPAGCNFKYDGAPSVELLEWNPELMYSVDDLVEAWNLDLDSVGVRKPAAGSAVSLPVGMKVKDEVLEWLADAGRVVSDTGGDWVTIQCPWHERHTSPGDTMGYKPLGRGERPESRGAKCHHNACTERNTVSLLEWIADQGGPRARVTDTVGLLVQQYVLLQGSNEVADIMAGPMDKYPIVPLAHWRAAHKQVAWVTDRGKKYYVCDEWQEDERMRRLDGRVYAPGAGMFPDGRYLNTYRAPQHVETRGEPSWFLDHLAWVVPNSEQFEMVLDWLAYKVQHPGRRSYGLIMVADFAEGEGQHRYGIGRSMLGDAIRAVLQSGVTTVDLDDVIGKGSQATYNEWAADAQLVIVEETKEEVGDWKTDVNHYERLKGLVDPKIIRNVRIKPKYGRIYYADMYFNMMLFTNHIDALALPEDDRRFLVVGNNVRRRTHAEYAAVIDALGDPTAIAQLYWYLMRREVTTDQILPAMTPEKQRMTESAATTLDEAWQIVLDQLPGDLVTQKQLMRAMERVVSVEFEDERMIGAAKTFARKKYRQMSYLEPGNRHTKIQDGENKVAVKVLRNTDRWILKWSNHTKKPGSSKPFLDEVKKNDRKTVRNL